MLPLSAAENDCILLGKTCLFWANVHILIYNSKGIVREFCKPSTMISVSLHRETFTI